MVHIIGINDINYILKNKFHCVNISVYEFKKRGIQMAKKKIDKQKLATRIIAGILAGLMVLSMAFTLIWYLIYNL